MLHSSLARSSSQLPILRVAYYASLHMLSLGGIILLAVKSWLRIGRRQKELDCVK